MKKDITSRDVAKEAGVSQSLVSMILNNTPGKKIRQETRDRVLKIAARLGYQANISARNMRNKSAQAIGLLSSWDAGSFVFPPVINGIKAVCTKNDLGLVICSGSKGPGGNYDFINYYMQNRIDGLIYISFVGVTKDGIISQLNKAGIPFVCIIGARDLPGVSCVDVSFIESGYMAINHLADRGYSAIAYLMPDMEERLNYAERERMEGCIRAAEERDIRFIRIKSLIAVSEEENRLKAVGELLDSRCFDAVVSTSHNCYVIIKEASKRNIRIPEELGVISLDNELYAPYLFPSLTTIDEPLFDIASAAAGILLEKIGTNDVCKKLEIVPVISVRDSTAKKT